jgi:hypothetical protein
MTDLIDKDDALETYTVADGDTLASIAGAKCAELGWEALAGLNFGADRAMDVLWALAETVGVNPASMNDPAAQANPENIALKPHADAVKTLKIPKKFAKTGLAMKKLHKMKLRRITPATIVSLESLDKWFVPGLDADKCRVRYALLGLGANATKLDMAFHGSNYGKCTDWKDGFSAFSALDKPVFKREALDVPEEQRATYEWGGETDVDEGVFKRDEIGAKVINAAFSPYTVSLRYRYHAKDKEAALKLSPFWPAWKKDGTLDAKTMKLEWEFKSTAGKLKRGLLQIVDGRDRLVFQKPLTATQMGDGKQNWTWDGAFGPAETNSKGGTAVIEDDMPYRMRVIAHSGVNERFGLGLTAMHSEVRVYVHKETHAADLDPYVAETNKPSLLLSVADSNPKHTPLVKADDGDMWVADHLSKAGVHCGAVNKEDRTEAFKRGVSEFLRSVPSTNAAPFGRFDMNEAGDMSDTAKTQLENIAAARKRPWFGKAADRSDYTMGSDELKTDLRKPDKDMILWVEDRFWYSEDKNGLDAGGTNIEPDVFDSPASAQPHRAPFEGGDKRVKSDARDIVRPHIPLQVQAVLLKRGQSLTDVIDIAAVPQNELDAMRHAVGPLRVDWTFDEIEPDPFDVPQIDTALYDDAVCRTKSALEWVLKKYNTKHKRKDVTRKTKYHNAPRKYGGERPYGGIAGQNHVSRYYKSVWGREKDKCLVPWRNKKDPGRESIVTVVHDRVDGAQVEEERFRARAGLAGIYFIPSRMAGDGYQLRAELRFDRTASYAMPNAKVLEARYPKLPQVHSAKLRTWRRTTLRAYVQWGDIDNSGAAWQTVRDQYALAHVHFDIENGQAAHNALANVKIRPSAVLDEPAYKAAVAACVRSIPAPHPVTDQRTLAWMALDDNVAWPLSQHKHWGMVYPKVGTGKHPKSQAWDIWNDQGDDLWSRFGEKIGIELVKKIEERLGLMRGHVIIDFRTTPDYRYGAYLCGTCGERHVFLEQAGVMSELNQHCWEPGCPGTLVNGIKKVVVTCDADPTHTATSSVATSTPEAIGHDFAACSKPGCGGRYIVTSHNDSPVPLRSDNDFDHLPFASMGVGNGVALNDAPNTTRKTPDKSGPGGKVSPRKGLLWAHEIGHNRNMLHAGNAPGGDTTVYRKQHDTRRHNANPYKNDKQKTARDWDRVCLMTYADQLETYNDDTDITCMCFKCVLKNRGWKVEKLALPPSDLHD